MNYLIGAGGHASVIENIANKNMFPLNGVFYDKETNNLTKLKKVGNFSDIKNFVEKNKFIISFGDVKSRIKLIESLKKYNVEWFSIIDTTAIIAEDVEIGVGTVIMPGVIINAGARIGNHVIINSGAIIEHGCIIEDYVHVSPGSTICGNSVVKMGSWIGAHSVIINGITIGKNTIVGAGTVVLKDVLNNSKVVGNPARQI